MSISKPEVAELQAHAKFEQGFRYLDRCGEAMVRLLKILHTDWTAGEITPTGGVLRNFALGMSAKFNAESVTVEQDDVIDFETFTDQTCKIYEVLWRTFEIERIRIPLLRVTVKVGCPDQTIASVCPATGIRDV